MLASLATGLVCPIFVIRLADTVGVVGVRTNCAEVCHVHDLQDLLGGQLANFTPESQWIMLFFKILVGAEGTGFELGVFSLSLGLTVMSGMVVYADLFNTNIDGYEVVIELQRVAVEVLCHV